MNAEADRWMEFARQDLRMAELALKEGIYSQACFHSQQCVEKCLKGMLADPGRKTPRTHSIVDLLGLFPPEFLGDLRDRLGYMDLYYIPTRYPDALPGSLAEGLPAVEDAEDAIAVANAIIKRWVEGTR